MESLNDLPEDIILVEALTEAHNEYYYYILQVIKRFYGQQFTARDVITAIRLNYPECHEIKKGMDVYDRTRYYLRKLNEEKRIEVVSSGADKGNHRTYYRAVP